MGKNKVKQKAERDQTTPGRERPTSGRSDQPVAHAGAPAPARPRGIRAFLPEGGLLPWWVVLLVSSYALLKLGLALEHPCGVLGMSGTVSRGSVSKAYRQLSMCTHPDKLRSRSAADMLRGELLFKRASAAREELLAAMRAPGGAAAEADIAEADTSRDASAAEASCSTQLDAAIYWGVLLMAGYLQDLGLKQIGANIWSSVLDVLFFSHGPTWSASLLLLSLSLASFAWTLLRYLATTGPLTAAASAAAALLVGPLPTLGLMLALPPMRAWHFVRHELLPALGFPPSPALGSSPALGFPPQAQAPKRHSVLGPSSLNTTLPAAAAAGTAGGGAAAGPVDEALVGAVGVESDEGDEGDDGGEGHQGGGGRGGGNGLVPGVQGGAGGESRAGGEAVGSSGHEDRRGLRHRVRPTSQSEPPADPETLLYGEPPGGIPSLRGEPGSASVNPFVRGWAAVSRRPPPHGRAQAAGAVQFDLLLSVTKPVIPLLCLLATGQVYNGLMFSLFTAQMLQRLPSVRSELTHCIVALAGGLHTLVNSDKAPPLEKSSSSTLQLSYSWTPRDVAAVTNILLLGATFAAVSGAGNEPPLCASFAAGLALRMAAYELLPPAAWAPLTRVLRGQALEFVGTDEVAARAHGGIGSCAGGPLRSALGWLGAPALPQTAGLLVKTGLLLLPVLAAAQWALRTASLRRRLQREAARQGRPSRLSSGELVSRVLRRRLAASAAMAAASLSLVVFYSSYQINGVNGSLGNLLTLAMVGCVLESLLATYDVRGRLRSALFFVLFMLL